MPGFVNQQSLAASFSFTPTDKSVDDSGIARQVMSFEVDGLTQSALVLWPGEPTGAGWPLLMFNHGFQFDPLSYGRIGGENARPGAYYWGSVQAYAEQGYVVVVADYRGHNDFDAQVFSVWQQILNAFAQKMHGIDKMAYLYTRYAIAAYFAAVKLPSVNACQVDIVGHSMGGGITQRSISLWVITLMQRLFGLPVVAIWRWSLFGKT